MPEISPRLRQHLDAHHVGYETIHHCSDYTARVTAADTHTPGRALDPRRAGRSVPF